METMVFRSSRKQCQSDYTSILWMGARRGQERRVGGLHSLFGSLLEGRGKGFERIWRSSLQPSNLLFFIFFKLRDLGRIGYALNEFFCTGLFTVKNLSNFKNVYHFPILSIYIKSYLLHSFLPYNQTRKEGGGGEGRQAILTSLCFLLFL